MNAIGILIAVGLVLSIISSLLNKKTEEKRKIKAAEEKEAYAQHIAELVEKRLKSESSPQILG